MTYQVRKFESLDKVEGFSRGLIDDHLALYEGYVTNTNDLSQKLNELVDSDSDPMIHDELRRRLGWEWNGMRLHELYFDNLGGSGELDRETMLSEKLERNLGGLDRWRHDIERIGGMRGVGWVILYFDPTSETLMNAWVDEHDSGHPSGAVPLVVMDVWEHAFWKDYGSDKARYVRTFLDNLDWGVACERYQSSLRTASVL